MPNQNNSIIARKQHATSAQRLEESIAEVAAHDAAILEAANPGETNEAPIEPSHNWEKRYKDLQSFNSRKINDLTQKLDAALKAPVAKVTVPKTQEELDSMRQSDPDGYAKIESIATAMMHKQLEGYNKTLTNVTQDLTQARIDAAEAQIVKAHPDFTKIINDDSFHQWAEAQATDVQDWIYNNPDQPQLAIRALSLYKAEKGMGTTNTQATTPAQTGDMDVNVRTNSQTPDAVDRNHPTYIWTESEIARMRPAEFGKWEKVITLAQNEGRVALGR